MVFHKVTPLKRPLSPIIKCGLFCWTSIMPSSKKTNCTSLGIVMCLLAIFKVFRPSALRLLNAAIELTIQHMFKVFQFSGLRHFSAAAEITIRVARQVNLNKKKCTYIPHVWLNGVCGSLLGDLTINILAPTYYFTNQHDSPLVQVYYDFEANR